MSGLSEDVVLHAFSFLNDAALLSRAARCSRSWRALASEDVLWQAQCERRWDTWQHRAALLGLPPAAESRTCRKRPRQADAHRGEADEDRSLIARADRLRREEAEDEAAESKEQEERKAQQAEAQGLDDSDDDSYLQSATAARPAPPAVPVGASPYQPYLHHPWHVRYLLAELDQYRQVLSPQELCGMRWRFLFQSELFTDASTAFYPRFMLDRTFRDLHFGQDMTWRLVEKRTEAGTPAAATAATAAAASTSAVAAATGATPSAATSAAARAMQSELQRLQSDLEQEFTSSHARHSQPSSTSSRRKHLIEQRLRTLLPSFFEVSAADLASESAAEATRAAVEVHSERVRAFLPHLAAAYASHSSALYHTSAPAGGVYPSEFPTQSQLHRLDAVLTRSVQVQHYPFLVSSRLPDGGWSLVNPFVVFSSMHPSVDVAAAEAETVARRAEALERRNRLQRMREHTPPRRGHPLQDNSGDEDNEDDEEDDSDYDPLDAGDDDDEEGADEDPEATGRHADHSDSEPDVYADDDQVPSAVPLPSVQPHDSSSRQLHPLLGLGARSSSDDTHEQ